MLLWCLEEFRIDLLACAMAWASHSWCFNRSMRVPDRTQAGIIYGATIGPVIGPATGE